MNFERTGGFLFWIKIVSAAGHYTFVCKRNKGTAHMKLTLSAALVAGALLAGISSVQAAPASPAAGISHVIVAADGCGRGWHRNYHGRCVRDRDEDDNYWRHHHRDRDNRDGCGRHYHRNRWGHCVPND